MKMLLAKLRGESVMLGGLTLETLNGDPYRPMPLLPRLMTILGCLLLNAGVGSSSVARDMLRAETTEDINLRRFDAFQCPVQLPPRRDSEVIRAGESEIDEEDTDKIPRPQMLSPRHPAFDAFPRFPTVAASRVVPCATVRESLASVLRC